MSSLYRASGDRDWFAIDLAARQSYRFRLTGSTLYNPNFFLRDVTGAILSYTDDLLAGRTYRLTVGSTDLTVIAATLFDGRGQPVVTSGTGDRVEISATIAGAGAYMREVGAGRAAKGSFRIDCIDVTAGIDRIPGLRNAGIRSVVNAGLADFVMSRQEIVSLIRSATQTASLSAQKLADLNGVALQVVPYLAASRAAYEQFILHAVLWGNPANAWWTGGARERVALGGSLLGSVGLTNSRLLGKWYLGSDLPTNFVGGDSAADAKAMSFGYGTASGPLFVDGVQYGDMDQGQAATCYMLAAAGRPLH